MLNESGDKHLRMSELADAALLTRSGMTRLVDRLERQGLVRRERCAADGRGTYAVITPEGSGPLRGGPPDAHRGRPPALPRPAQEEGSARAGRRVRHRARRRTTASSRVVYPRGGMRPVAGTRRWAHARTGSARARPPSRRARGPASSPRIAVCVLVAVLVLTPLTLLHDLPNAYDTDAFYAPFAAFLHDRLSHGDFPLWNPFAFSGQPFAADPQSGVLYPPALVSYGLLAPGERDGRPRHVPLPARDALVVRVRAPRAAPAAWAPCTPGIAFGVGGLPAGPLAGARAADGRRLAGGVRGRCAVRRDAPGARSAHRSSSPATLALSILGGSQQLTLVAATSALVVLVLQLRWRGLAVFAGAGAVALGPRRGRAPAAARAREPLDGRQRE